jgi:hypothetical protein
VTLDLEAIEARANAASKGPWMWANADQDCWSPCTAGGCPGHDTGIPESLPEVGIVVRDVFEEFAQEDGTYSQWIANARFIASARADIPALIAEVRKLRGQLHDAGLPDEEPVFQYPGRTPDAPFHPFGEPL